MKESECNLNIYTLPSIFLKLFHALEICLEYFWFELSLKKSDCNLNIYRLPTIFLKVFQCTRATPRILFTLAINHPRGILYLILFSSFILARYLSDRGYYSRCFSRDKRERLFELKVLSHSRYCVELP